MTGFYLLIRRNEINPYILKKVYCVVTLSVSECTQLYSHIHYDTFLNASVLIVAFIF